MNLMDGPDLSLRKQHHSVARDDVQGFCYAIIKAAIKAAEWCSAGMNRLPKTPVNFDPPD
jgi:hypothetical protein